MLGRYKCRALSTAGWDARVKHRFVQLKDTLLGSSSKGTNHSCFCFPVAIALVPCFGLWSIPLPPLWGFQELLYFLTFFYLLLWAFLFAALTSICIGINYFFQITPRECSGIFQRRWDTGMAKLGSWIGNGQSSWVPALSPTRDKSFHLRLLVSRNKNMNSVPLDCKLHQGRVQTFFDSLFKVPLKYYPKP